MCPSASSATSNCSSVSGRSWTALAMFSAIRRAVAANASDSCGATGARSDASTLLLPSLLQAPRGLVEDLVGDLLLARARHPPLVVGGHDHDLVRLGVEPDVRARDVVDDDGVQALRMQLTTAIGRRTFPVLGRQSDQHLVRTPGARQPRQHVLGALELDRR